MLTESGIKFEIRVQDIDESFEPSMPVLSVAEYLALKKADTLSGTLKGNEILLTADSVVIVSDKIYNKPENYWHGIEILTALSGKIHTVATGVCIKSPEKTVSFTTTTQITFDEISNDEMNYYLNEYKPYDKAGAYGIQDWIGLCKVSKIEGSYSNVMGLPMYEVYNCLKSF